jgi:hypothetical protein
MEHTEKTKEQMRTRLKKISEKKFRTTMIFALAEFENMFGQLWGHGKAENELTDEELNNRRKWSECRTRILDNGHKQSRGFGSEIDMHTVIWNRYTYVFTPRDIADENFNKK